MCVREDLVSQAAAHYQLHIGVHPLLRKRVSLVSHAALIRRSPDKEGYGTGVLRWRANRHQSAHSNGEQRRQQNDPPVLPQCSNPAAKIHARSPISFQTNRVQIGVDLFADRRGLGLVTVTVLRLVMSAPNAVISAVRASVDPSNMELTVGQCSVTAIEQSPELFDVGFTRF